MNDPEKIKRTSNKIIEKMGWLKLTDYNVSERQINNLVRAMENSENENRLVDIVANELDRQFHTPLPKRRKR